MKKRITFNILSIIVCMILSIIVCMGFLDSVALAQDNKWVTDTVDNGKISVTYRISARTDEHGEKLAQIEDMTVTVEDLEITNCITTMKDIANHKKFTGDFKSEMIREISENEWIIYYYTKNPWPIPDSDCVARMKFIMDENEHTAIFSFTAAPDEFIDTKVNRMTDYYVSYTFLDLGNGKVQITETAKTTPPVKVPLWLIKSAFPGAPANAMKKLVALAKQQQL